MHLPQGAMKRLFLFILTMFRLGSVPANRYGASATIIEPSPWFVTDTTMQCL